MIHKIVLPPKNSSTKNPITVQNKIVAYPKDNSIQHKVIPKVKVSIFIKGFQLWFSITE